jgi:hypothetical protein
VANTIEREVQTLMASLGNFHETHCFVVESDSSDDTVKKLAQLTQTMPHFSYVSMGQLSKQYPRRTDRIALCRNAIINAANQGIRFAIAAGNSGQDADGFSPANAGDHPNVYTVSAVYSTYTMASWSNWDQVTDSDPTDSVDLAAPGVAVTSYYKNGVLTNLSGTSMAARRLPFAAPSPTQKPSRQLFASGASRPPQSMAPWTPTSAALCSPN